MTISKKMKRLRSLTLMSGGILLLAGCSGVGGELRDAMGITQRGPDEFAVYQRAPLEIPADYSLDRPQPGAQRPQETSARDLASQSLTGRKASASGGNTSGGEQALLSEANASNTDPTIRQQVNAETEMLAEEQKGPLDSFFGSGDRRQYGDVVDPNAEAKRIDKAQTEGKPVNDGNVPKVKNRRKGWFEGWFN